MNKIMPQIDISIEGEYEDIVKGIENLRSLGLIVNKIEEAEA